ncbi:MAG TPA: phytanoyl-CoA dioxygenase family protein [Polyangiaceae bacterium]|nr:phytanoyl-CoA dioxygenase family protein [Polyangiaceae bacterium]
MSTTPERKFTDEQLDAHAEELRRDGICTLRGLLPRELIDAWARAFAALVEARRGRPGGLAPRGPGRFYVTLPWVPPFADAAVFANPDLVALLERIFPQEYRLVQLAADTPERGSAYQEVHRDYRPLFTDQIVTPLYALAVNFPLCDVTPENGPLEMARGTHVLPREVGLAKVASGERPLEQFTMRAGDVAVRTPLALHRGTPNLTDRPRPMVVLGYVMHWLHTPKVDLRVPRAYYESLPPALRALLRCEVVDELREDAGESYVEFAY